MSMAALRWCRPVKCTPTQKVVLWALADHADEHGEAWPSIAGLIEATCLSERSVRGALRELEVCGLIKTTPGGGRNRTSTYHLAMDQNGAARAETRQDAPRIPPEEKGQLVQEKGQILHERGQLVQEKGHVLPPNPQEPIQPSRTLTVSVRAIGFDAWWQAYPRKVGKDAARTAYLAALKRGATEPELLAAIHRQRWPTEARFVPHARTWLTQGRWQDDPADAAPPETRLESIADAIAAIQRDPMGKGPPASSSFDFEGTAEEIRHV